MDVKRADRHSERHKCFTGIYSTVLGSLSPTSRSAKMVLDLYELNYANGYERAEHAITSSPKVH